MHGKMYAIIVSNIYDYAFPKRVTKIMGCRANLSGWLT